MNVKSLLLIAALFSFGTWSCAPTKPKPTDPNGEEAKKPPEKAPELVGRIASVPADKRFVLIQSYGKWNGESGQILTTRGPENRTAHSDKLDSPA